MTNGIVLQNELKRALRWLTAATVALYLILAGVGGYLFVTADHQRDDIQQVTESTSMALCSFVHDLERRVEASEQFLEENPEGIPGISAATIRQSIANLRATLESLEQLKCPPEEL